MFLESAHSIFDVSFRCLLSMLESVAFILTSIFGRRKNAPPIPQQLDMSGAESHGGDLAPKKRRAAGNQSSQKRLSVGAMVEHPEMVVSGIIIMAIIGWFVGIIILWTNPHLLQMPCF